MQIDNNTISAHASLKVTLSHAYVLVCIVLHHAALARMNGLGVKTTSISSHAQRRRPTNTSFVCTHYPHSYTTWSKSVTLFVIKIERAFCLRIAHFGHFCNLTVQHRLLRG